MDDSLLIKLHIKLCDFKTFSAEDIASYSYKHDKTLDKTMVSDCNRYPSTSQKAIVV